MTKIKACLLIGLLCSVFTILSYALPVSTDTLLAKHILLLKQKQTTLQKTLEKLSLSAHLPESTLSEDLLISKMKLSEIIQTIQFAETEKSDLLSRQRNLKKHLDSPTVLPSENTKITLEEINQDLLEKDEEVRLLKQNQSLLESIKTKQDAQLKKIRIDKRKEKREAKAKALKEQVQHLRQVVDNLLNEKTRLFIETTSSLNPVEKQVKSNLLSIESNIALLDIKYLNLKIKLYFSEEREPVQNNLPVIIYKINVMHEIASSLHKTEKLQIELVKDLATKPVLWQGYVDLGELSRTNQRQFLATLSQLQQKNRELALSLQTLEKRTIVLTGRYDRKRAELLGLRRGIISLDMPHWKKIFQGVLSIPQHFMTYVYSLLYRLQSFISGLPILKQFALILLITVLILFWLTGKNVFNQFVETDKKFKFGEDFFHVLTRLFKHNWGVVSLFIGLLLLFNLAAMSLTSYKLIVELFVVWFAFRAILGVLRLALLEAESDIEGHDVALYHRLKWTFIVGGIVTVMLVLSHELNITNIVTDMLNRLFMLFMFTVSIILLLGRHVILRLLKLFIKPKRIYVKRALALLTLLTPIALMMNAMIGLLGYAFFAWEMSYYLLVIVLTLVGYVVVRGILNDAMSISAEGLIRHTKNGWLWTEVILKPAHKILKLLLFLSLFVVIVILCGWNTESNITVSLIKLWQFHIFNFSRVDITIGSFIEFIILVSIFIWASKWTRECCYRWIYRHVKDVGIRNSFSVFTQYIVVTLGTIVTLRVLGIDISGLSMILGGLAVGMGFGLRDFANNIVGGLMLLIERPVKVGDLISVDNFEGRVTHIGIRSLRVRSWDHMEVMIPNAKTFSSAFTNWTHQDDVVRTVIPIKVSRQDSPVKVQQLILDVLSIIPEVLEDPSTQVYLKHIDEALIEFEVRYFIDIKAHSRMEVRSITLFAITAQFKAAGIKPPIPPVSIENLKPCSE